MPFLPARHYVSDHTRFISDLLAKKPELETNKTDLSASQRDVQRAFEQGAAKLPPD